MTEKQEKLKFSKPPKWLKRRVNLTPTDEPMKEDYLGGLISVAKFRINEGLKQDYIDKNTPEFNTDLRDRSYSAQRDIARSWETSGRNVDIDHELRPLSIPERKYMRHLFFEHYKKSGALINAGMSMKKDPAMKSMGDDLARVGRAYRQGVLQEISHHFGKIWAEIVADHSKHDELHKYGLSSVSNHKMQRQKKRLHGKTI